MSAALFVLQKYGVFTKDASFLQAGKDYKGVYNGQYISITRRQDGSLKPNFKPVKMEGDFNIHRYAFGVYRELHQALEGLIEK